MTVRARLARVIISIAVIVTGVAVMATSPDPDAVPLTRTELYAYLAGKTQVRDDGGTFFSDSGRLEIVKGGRQGKGVWNTADGGIVCVQIYAWETVWCETYYRIGDVVSVVLEASVSRAPELQDGNTLDLLTDSGLFSREQTIAFLSGKTAIWGPGQGVYYAPDFTLLKIWSGVRGTGFWSVTAEGAVCWHIPGWGPTPCESYYYRGDKLAAVFQGQHSKARKHVDGNQIGTF